jgi:hypothetical protein
VGLYNWEIAAAHSQVVEQVQPDPQRLAFYDELASIYADVYRALDPIYPRLARLQP